MKIVAIESTFNQDLLNGSLYEALRMADQKWAIIGNHQNEVILANEFTGDDDDILRAMTAAAVLRSQRNQIRDQSRIPGVEGCLVDGYLDSAWVHVGDINAVRFQRYFSEAMEESVPTLTVLFLCTVNAMTIDPWRTNMRILTGRATLNLPHYMVVDLDKRPELIQEALYPEKGLTGWTNLLAEIKAKAQAIPTPPR